MMTTTIPKLPLLRTIYALDELAEELFLTEPPDFLHEIEALLDDKKQVIFQGPPGTGKTYVAQQLANHLAGSKDRVTLVQFHPSYAYEDFVRGFRPALMNGQPGFELKDGPLLRAAKRARKSRTKSISSSSTRSTGATWPRSSVSSTTCWSTATSQ